MASTRYLQLKQLREEARARKQAEIQALQERLEADGYQKPTLTETNKWIEQIAKELNEG